MAERRYLNAKQVCARYGDKSTMTLWRWCRDPKLAFPQPIKINRINLWAETDLDAFDARVSGKVAA
jgi:predicted DNA-binding transcriptional regulator AlpA